MAVAQPLIIPVSSLDDARIEPYTRLKERDLAREGGRFIAEGELVVRRLLNSVYATESLLVATRRLDEMAPLVPAGVPVYAADHELVNRIVGFKFHSGIMAVGLRGHQPALDELAAGWGEAPLTLVVCPEVEKTDNLGSLIRIASAFGADALILGERCCDPFYRQSIRVSMGAVFSLPLVRSERLLDELLRLRDGHGFELIASILSPGARPLAQCRRGRRIALLFGNEAQGLGPELVAQCQQRVVIPMQRGIDSLNVSVAAGVFLYHFTQAGTAGGG
jgi:tRNA G18 (ribose-2'-O)-methylase SpoU